MQLSAFFNSPDREACLLVSDCGPGIAPGERERVFEPFYRPQGRSEDGGGWGLGLALVRQIVERHQGVVTCGIGASGGSRFEVRLPLRDPASPVLSQSLERGRAPAGETPCKVPG